MVYQLHMAARDNKSHRSYDLHKSSRDLLYCRDRHHMGMPCHNMGICKEIVVGYYKVYVILENERKKILHAPVNVHFGRQVDIKSDVIHIQQPFIMILVLDNRKVERK